MRYIDTDIAIIGAGIAGAGAAAELAGDFKVVVVEQEDRPGYHSTGRSAALFIRNYGNATIRALSRASAPLFEGADTGPFSTAAACPARPALRRRCRRRWRSTRRCWRQADGLREISADEAVAIVPVLRRERIAAAAYEEDAQDIDVAALHDGWLRKARAAGAELITGAPLLTGLARSRQMGDRDGERAHQREHPRQRRRCLGRQGGESERHRSRSA